MAKTPGAASALAKELQQLNVARQKQSAAITKEITELVEKEKTGKQFLFAAAPHYPYGIVGLVAGRLANLFQKPTAILTKGETTSRGSFRSVPGFSVIEALEKCADLLTRYGGHEQAAGMHLENKHLEAFEERFNALVEEWQNTQEKITDEKILAVDAEILPVHIGNELWRDLKKLAPFGEGNREPVLGVRGAIIQSIRFLGKNSDHLKLTVRLENKTFDAIAFNFSQSTEYLTEGTAIDIACTLSENSWNGRTSLQLRLLDVQ
jgi:single-stranded-DNA-specific exonuclease